MKRFLSLLFIVCLLLCKGIECHASHLFGGELLYTNILNDSTYVVKLTLYGDCGTISPELLALLNTSTPRIMLYNGGSFVDSFDVKPLTGTGIDVSPVCPSEVSQTQCNGGTVPGVRQYIYTDTIQVHVKSTTLRFVFDGTHLYPDAAGRSTSITNLPAGSSTLMNLEADLNNANGPNSSPQYATIPTPFYCINVLEQYNQGATDPNDDSLVFALAHAIDGQTGEFVNYAPPFTATAPLSTSSFLFNPINGQMSFNANIVQRGLIVTQVSEYRGGVLVGTSQREMTFVIQDNCTGTAPSASIVDVAGATITDSTVINICKNAPHVSFDIHISNPDGDSTYLTPSGVPASAVLTVTGNGTGSPSASFSWNTDTLSVGTYTFFLNIKNNHCPIYNTETIAYTINVANVPTIAEVQISPTECIHGAAIQFDLTQGFIPRIVTITEGGTVIATLTDTSNSVLSGTIIDSLPAGNYVATVGSDALCKSSVAFTINDSGTIPHVNADESLCTGDNTTPISFPLVNPAAVVVWHETNGIPLLGAPVPNTFEPATYTWYFVETYKLCTSGPDTVHVTVNPLPTVAVLDIPQTVCYGDEIKLIASGGVSYTWQPSAIVTADSGNQYAIVLSPVTLTVTATDANNCKDSASVTYSDIQPCCNFSFPTAFTPNNDGNNDGFRIVTYGNMLKYSLSIYNRFGQRIFWTEDPYHRWDGTFHGEPCDIGTYYYILDAQCLTGQKKVYKGDVALIR